jgi:uncharacterized spore protein YtfJ
LYLILIRASDNFLNTPDVRRKSSLHRWHHAQGLVNARDVVVHEVERHRRSNLQSEIGNLQFPEVPMSSPAPFEPVTALLERTLNIRHVYGEPIQRGDTTVIPVAKVVYGFGAGGGQGRRRTPKDDGEASSANSTPDGQGAGGGGGVRMTPVGVLELGPHGTRYLPFNPLAPLLGAAALGLVAGLILGRRA